MQLREVDPVRFEGHDIYFGEPRRHGNSIDAQIGTDIDEYSAVEFGHFIKKPIKTIIFIAAVRLYVAIDIILYVNKISGAAPGYDKIPSSQKA